MKVIKIYNCINIIINVSEASTQKEVSTKNNHWAKILVFQNIKNYSPNIIINQMKTKKAKESGMSLSIHLWMKESIMITSLIKKMRLNMANLIVRLASISLVESLKIIENLVVKHLKSYRKRIIGLKRKIFRYKLQRHFQI